MSDMITIKLTQREAELVRQNTDGWLDAGACEGGLTTEEHDALWKVISQIDAGEKRLMRKKK